MAHRLENPNDATALPENLAKTAGEGLPPPQTPDLYFLAKLAKNPLEHEEKDNRQEGTGG